MVDMTIGDRLKQLRVDAGLTQPEMAAIVGTSKQYVSQLEGGANKTPNGEFLDGWARHFRVSHRWLTTGKGQMVASQTTGRDDATMQQAVELLHLLADARPEDKRLQRPTWAMILIAAKAIERAEGASREAMPEILAELSKET